MTSRSPWPLVISIFVTLVVAIGGFATRGDRVPPPAPVEHAQSVAGPRYVAIGDSFTAGGPIRALQPKTGSCLRSSFNYPSLVARELGYTLTDASCFGATTQDALISADGLPAQVAAVSHHTGVVTVSLGGNDLGVYSTIFLNCLHKPGSVSVQSCQAMLGPKIALKTAEVSVSLGAVLDAIHHRAPKARIVVLDYLSLMPRSGACSAIPFAPGDVRWFAGVEDDLSKAIEKAARQRDLEVIDVHALSRGHDVCSGTKAWVNGARPKHHDGILFHPNGAGERAVATALADRLREKGS